jgi:hypothetical protein
MYQHAALGESIHSSSCSTGYWSSNWRNGLQCPDRGGRSTGDRVVRGGSWNNNQRNARPSDRNRNNPDNSNNNIGFRLVSHIFPLPSRQCPGSSNDAGPRQNGVTCPWPALASSVGRISNRPAACGSFRRSTRRGNLLAHHRWHRWGLVCRQI